LKEDVIGQRRRLAKYIKRLQRFASVVVDFRPVLEWIFGSVFWVDFSPLFGLRAFGKLLVLLCFSSFGLDLGALFGPLLDRTFHHPAVRVLGGLGRVSRRVGLACLVGFRCLACWFQVVGGYDRCDEWTRDSYRMPFSSLPGGLLTTWTQF
jgi:hypothetical protein